MITYVGNIDSKIYKVSVNGVLTENEIVTIKTKERYKLELTNEEYNGIKKLFNLLGSSEINSITGLGVEPL